MYLFKGFVGKTLFLEKGLIKYKKIIDTSTF